jgi:uncharacterized protein
MLFRRYAWIGGVLGAVLCLCSFVAAQQPAPAAPPAPPDPPGKFVWFDLLTDDANAAKEFYGPLLGWQFEQLTGREWPYWLIRHGGVPIGGIVEVEKTGTSGPQWLSYLTVSNIGESAVRVRERRGQVRYGPKKTPGGTPYAVVTDPQGALFGMVQPFGPSLTGDAKPVAGGFLWVEYVAADAAFAAAFYGDIAGWSVRETDTGTPADYWTFSRDGRPRAGMFKNPWPNVKPNWLPYVLAEDPGSLAEKARSLGGQIVLSPRAEVRGGTLAIVADRRGAVLALQKWPLPDTARKGGGAR